MKLSESELISIEMHARFYRTHIQGCTDAIAEAMFIIYRHVTGRRPSTGFTEKLQDILEHDQ